MGAQPNRDTLAFLVLHFKRVAEVTENKMTLNSLAKILGPTIVGYRVQTPLQRSSFQSCPRCR